MSGYLSLTSETPQDLVRQDLVHHHFSQKNTAVITDGLKGHEDVLAENSTKLSLGFAGLDHWSYFSCRTEEHRASPLLVGGISGDGEVKC